MQEDETCRPGERSTDGEGVGTPVCLEDEKTNRDTKSGGNLEGSISISSLSNFKERKFFMFEDDSGQCRNYVIELGGKVEEFFDVLTITDLVVDRKIDGSVQPVKFNTYSRGKRAINCSAKRFSPRFNVVALKNNISVLTKGEFYQLIQSERAHRSEAQVVQETKQANVRKLKPPFIKVEDQSRRYSPIFREFEKWPGLEIEDDYDSAPERPTYVAVKVEKRVYCEQYVLKSQLEMHCNGEGHKSITRQTGYWNNVDALISKLTSLTELEDKKSRKI